MSVLKSTSVMCITFFLPGYRHEIFLFACLVLLCWNPLTNPLQNQGGFFQLSHKQGLSRFHSLRSKRAFIPFPKNWLHMFAVFTSLTRNINIDLILQRHTNFIFSPLSLTKMLSEFRETWLKSSGKIISEGKDCKELNARALSKYWQLWKAPASDWLESKQWAKLLQYAGDI